MEGEKKEKGLQSWEIALMISVALFYDALQWLLTFVFMGWAVSIFAFLTFYVWFKIKGISFMKPKRALAMGGSFLIELIPFLNVIPAWTFTVAFLALESKAKNVVAKVPGGQIAASAISGKTTPSTSNLKKEA